MAKGFSGEDNWVRGLKGIQSIRKDAMDAMKNTVATVQGVSLKRVVKSITSGSLQRECLHYHPLVLSQKSPALLPYEVRKCSLDVITAEDGVLGEGLGKNKNYVSHA